MALNLKHLLNFDDALDVFAVHGIGGIVGNILTGIFAQKKYAKEIEGGWLDSNWIQIVYQLIDTVAGLIWSFVVTFLILWIMNKIPGLSLRVDIEIERAGLDQGELGFNISEREKSERLRKKSVKGFNEPLGPQAIVRSGGLDHRQLEFSEQIKDDRRRRKSVKGFNEPLGSQTNLQTGGLDHRELGDLGVNTNEQDKGERQRRNGHTNVAFQIDQHQEQEQEQEQSRM